MKAVKYNTRTDVEEEVEVSEDSDVGEALTRNGVAVDRSETDYIRYWLPRDQPMPPETSAPKEPEDEPEPAPEETDPMTEPNPYAGLRGPQNPDDFRVDVRRSRHYWDTLPKDELRPEGPMTEKTRTKVALPAQSTIMKAIPADALLYWAVTKTAEYAVDERAAWQLLERSDAINVLQRAHRKASNKAADRGTGVHEYLEAKLEGREIDLTYIDEDALPYLPIVDQFLRQQEPELLLAEVVGIGEKHGCTTDGIIRLPHLDVALSVVDWKSRNDTVKKPHVVYDKEVAQLGANLDLRYWIVEDIATGEAKRVPVPENLGAVLVTFTTTSYAVHLVDPEQAVAGFRSVVDWWEKKKELPKAAKGVKVYELEGAPESPSPDPGPQAPTEEPPAAEIENPSVSEAPELTPLEQIEEVYETIDTDPEESSVEEEEVGLDADTLRTRMSKLIDAGHQERLTALWTLPVGLSDATPDQYPEILKIIHKAEAAVGAPFDEPSPEPVNKFVKDERTAPKEPSVEEGPEVGEADVEVVHKGWLLLEDEGADWVASIAERTGNISVTQLASGRRARIGWAIVRLGVAGWHDDELLAACLVHAKCGPFNLSGEQVPEILSKLSFGAAGRLSETVTELLEGELTFSVSDTAGGLMRLEPLKHKKEK